MIFLTLIKLILITDFLTGFVHWLEDTYGNPNSPIIGKIIVQPNIEHHKSPRKFLQGTFWERTKLSLAAGLIILAALTVFFGFNWQVAFVCLHGSLANEIHAASHRSDRENGKIICFLQEIGLMGSRKMHGLHHRNPFDTNFCVMTDWLNPLLSWLQFWQYLEWILALFGIKSIRNSDLRSGK